jgi:3-phosphoshikimate 1-carboxyvinyltransferase
MDHKQMPAQLKIKPISNPLNSQVSVPGSKSLTNRSLLIGALAHGTTVINNALFSEDTIYFVSSLQKLGFYTDLSPDNKRMVIKGMGGEIPVNEADLFVGNAGTAARFLTAFLTLGSGEFILDGDSRMRERPIGDLINGLIPLGAKIEVLNNHQDFPCPPLKFTASGLSGGKTKLAGNISSQYLSALLMIAPYARRPVEIEITTELYSKPYVDMSLAVMSDFGVNVERQGYNRFLINPAVYGSPRIYQIESDASAASYFFAAPAICGGSICVKNINRKSLQGDIGFLEVLGKMGCDIAEKNNSINVTGPDDLIGVDVDMRDISDTAQTLAAIAPFAKSPTRIRGIKSSRMKETDRVSATCAELDKMGVVVEEHEDGLTVYPCNSFQPTKVETYNDHRMAMAFSLMGLRIPGTVIENPGCVDKTFPQFFEVLDSIR